MSRQVGSVVHVGVFRSALALFVLLACVAVVPGALAGELVVDVRVPVDRIAIDESGAVRVDGPGYLVSADPGTPALPYRVVSVALPQGTAVDGFSVSGGPETVVRSGLRPAISPAMIDEHGVATEARTIFESPFRVGEAFPQARARYLGTGLKHGYAIASFAVFPVRIDGDDILATETLKLDIRTTPHDWRAVTPLRYRAERRAAVETEVAAVVVNPSAVLGYAFDQTRVEKTRGGFQPTTYPSLEGSPVDYVIITNDSLVSAYQQLADWKTAKGIPTVIRTTEWIEANYRNGVDIQETIRNFIIDAYEKWGIRYVLLGGDTDQIPARYLWTGYHDGGRLLPVDMYFGGLDGDWNADHDATFGENPDDNPDLYVEVFTGRLPTASSAAAELLIGKIMTYEQPPDRSYTNRFLWAAEVLFPTDWEEGENITLNGASVAEFVYLSSQSTSSLDVVRMYQTDTTFPGSVPENKEAVLDSLDAGFSHFGHVGHGFRFNMSVADASIQNADADQLTNGNRYFNVYMLNCTAAAFQYNCLAERFLLAENGGAASAVGANESAFPTASSNYMNSYYQLLIQDNIVNIGETFARSREARTPIALAADNADFWTHYIYSLLADPEMQLWTDVVDTLQVSHPSNVGLGTTPITVTVLDGGGAVVDSATVCLSKGDDDYQVGQTDGAGQVTLNFRAESAGTIRVVATGRNHSRYEGEITVGNGGGAYVALNSIAVDDDNAGGTSGNGDGVIDSGETFDWTFEVRNTGDAASGSVTLALRCNDVGVTILDSTATVGVVGAGGNAAASDAVRVSLSPTVPDETVLSFTVAVKEGGVETWTDTFRREAHAPELALVKIRMDDTASGNGDGVVDPNETFDLYYRVKNFGTGAMPGASIYAIDLDDGFVFVDSADTYGAIAPNTSAENAMGMEMREPDTAIEHRILLSIVDSYGRAYFDTLEARPPDAPGPATIDPGLGSDRLGLSWTASVSSDVRWYNVYRSLTPGGPYTSANTDPVRHTTYVDVGLSPTTTYYYRICAVDVSGNESSLSPESSGSTNPLQLAGFPIALQSETTSSPVVGDIDGDGDLEIVQGNQHVYAWHADANELVDGDNDPQTWGVMNELGDNFVGHLALARIDGRPGLDIVAPSRLTQEVYVFDYTGAALPGWPQPVENNIRAGVAVGDLDNDGRLEVIGVDEGGVVYAWEYDGVEHVDGDGNPGTPGVLARLPGATFHYSTPALADLDNDGEDEIIVGTQADSLYVLNGDGSPVPGWPVPLLSDISGSPAVGDLDDDGDLEVVVNTNLGTVYAFHHDGTSLWTRFLANGLFFAPSPALADIDKNGTLETFVPSSNGNLYGIDHTGSDLPGWPVQFSSTTYTESSPSIADIDGDGDEEVLLGDETQFIRAWNPDGSLVDGFPLKTEDAMRGVPCIIDVDRDGDVDLVATGWDTQVYVWDFPGTYDYKLASWPQFHANNRNNGLIGSVIPSAIGDVTFAWELSGGALSLSWYLPPTAGALFDVDRALVAKDDAAEPAFERVATDLAVDLDGHLAFLDRRVAAGERYVYRITSRDADVGSFTSRQVYVPVTRAELGQNYPNPFNPVTRIPYLVPDGGARQVSLIVYDVRGARVRTLVNGRVPGGRYVVEWDGRNDSGVTVGSGIYFYRMVLPGFTETRKMLILK